MLRNRWLVFILIVLLAIGFSGCAKKESPPPQSPGPSSNTPMQDHTPILADMNKAVDDITVKAKANQVPQAKESMSSLSASADKLTPHFTDTAFRDNLRTAIRSLNEEMSKSNPNSAEVEKRAQNVKSLLQQSPAKMMQQH